MLTLSKIYAVKTGRPQILLLSSKVMIFYESKNDFK